MSIFSNIKVRKPKKSKFDLSHERKMSIKMGKIYPILLQEIVPGDSFKVSSEILARLAPMISPVMHRINIQTHYFFVPNRLVWNEWQDFITGGESGNEEPAYPVISLTTNNAPSFRKGRLPDYFGIPSHEGAIGTTAGSISAIPFRAYQMIYNEYFRDQNLESKIEYSLGGGSTPVGEATIITEIRQRPWEKDYFTSALPWPQRGGEASVPVEFEYDPTSKVKDIDGVLWTDAAQLATNEFGHLAKTPTGDSLRVENLTGSSEITINDLRKATRLQEWLEKSARGGSRYIEQIFSHFGVRSSDSRLQRPELLGSGRQPVVISEVLQTSETPDTQQEDGTPQGNMAGHGISVGKSNGFKRTFEEHGYVIGVMSVLPKTTYQQGIERHWNKTDKFDYYWPEFANLGEQEILNTEIYHNFDAPENNNETWGYQQRYAEYKYQQSSVHGDFRESGEDKGLNFWHMGRIFNNLPPLNQNFIHSDPTTRIFAVTDEDIDTMYVQIYNKISALRPMPYHSIPSL